MDAELKTRWLKALRSGEYNQGTGYLCRLEDGKPTFCCLGVLFDLQGATWTDEGKHSRGCTIHGNEYQGNSQKSKLARAFPFIPEPTIKHLMAMNDGNDQHRQGFRQIADYIEANL